MGSTRIAVSEEANRKWPWPNASDGVTHIFIFFSCLFGKNIECVLKLYSGRHIRWNSWNHFHCNIEEKLIRETGERVVI